ncbi:Cytochrome c4 [Candidatus Glomeribacter gigasporarum BEG34]|uniref:Cytochrome c4 n=1 Tax=Candidatus Glomeribacter gigasporarum BEG34 TaxID=1070319 RepID=G2J8S8_9BURK|nr:c-type cytochrome [Candidatus Glomeribacter gigasporarum]CCD29175.1 Cytochrome c4 [Candidatus Glomeribacter gigasporarum BEG34]
MSQPRISRRALRVLIAGIGWSVCGWSIQSGWANADLERGQAIAVQVCAACHQNDGRGAVSVAPKLAAQHAQYLYKQLADYRTKPNETAPERSSPVMAGFAAALSGQDMQDVAAYFAVQPVSTAFAQHPEDIELGQKIWRRGIQERRVPACAACHSATGAGIPVQYPRLAGQWQDYTIEQLKAFQSGARHNNLTMQTIAKRLLEPEIRAVADYIAGLR